MHAGQDTALRGGQGGVLEVPPGTRVLGVLASRENRRVLRVERDAPGRAPTRGSFALPEPAVRTAVLKCLVPRYSPDEAASFEREFLLLDALEHPCWIRASSFGRIEDGPLWIELEAAPGEPLGATRLRGWCPELLEVSRQVLSGLEALHRLGHAHLDLHPDQVLVEGLPEASRGWGTRAAGPGPRARLLDLGLAASFGTPMLPRGTPGYIAPEILRRERDWDGRADLYAFGALLFELLTGGPAFCGSDLATILAAQVRNDPPDPGAEAGLPPPVRRLLRELLAPNPTARPESALAVWQRLREHAPRTGTGERPAQLSDAASFPFRGREATIAAARSWWREPESGVRECLLAGRTGCGRGRLANRLRAIAQVDGWVLEDPGARVLRRGEATLRIRVAADAPQDGAALTMPAARPGSREEGSELRRPRGGSDPRNDPSRLRLEIGPLASEDLDAILRASGIESAALRGHLAEHALGNPGLLSALVAVLPSGLDPAARWLAPELMDDVLAAVEPPGAFVEHARLVLAAAADGDADRMIAAALCGGCMHGVAPDPLCATTAAGAWRIRSGIWSKAVLQASADRAAALAERLLEGAEPLPDSEEPADLVRARLAVRVREPGSIRRTLGPALDRLSEAGRAEDELALFCAAASACPDLPAEGLVGPQRLLRVARLFYGLGGSGGGALGTLPEQSLAGEGGRQRLLRAWASMQRAPESVPVLLDAGFASGEETLLARWIAIRLAIQRRRPEDAEVLLDVAESLAERIASPHRYRIAAARAEVRMARRELAAADAGLASAEPWSVHAAPAERTTVLQVRAHLDLARGDFSRLRTGAEAAERLAREAGLQSHRLAALGIVNAAAYHEGDLPRVQESSEESLRLSLRTGAWPRAVTSALNVVLVALDRGRLGEALQTLADAARWAEAGADLRNRIRVGMQEVHVRARLGQAERAVAAAVDLLEGPIQGDLRREPLVRASRAEALWILGAAGEAREEMGRAIAQLEEAGAGEDAAEARVVWGLWESIAGDPGRAESLAAAAAGREELSRLTSALLQLLEGEIALVAGERGAAARLARAAASLEAQDRWYYAWRAHWRLARATAAEGDFDRVLQSYATARTALATMLDTLGSPGLEDAFLDAPAPRIFLEELDGAGDTEGGGS